jgi:hypothetical protein
MFTTLQYVSQQDKCLNQWFSSGHLCWFTGEFLPLHRVKLDLHPACSPRLPSRSSLSTSTLENRHSHLHPDFFRPLPDGMAAA